MATPEGSAAVARRQASPRLAALERALPTLGIATSQPSRISLRRERFYRRALAVSDCLAVTLSVLIGVGAVGGQRLTATALATLPLFVLGAKLVGVYDRDELVLNKTTLEETPRLFELSTLLVLVF